MEMYLKDQTSGAWIPVPSLVSTSDVQANQVLLSNGTNLEAAFNTVKNTANGAMQTDNYTGTGTNKVNLAKKAEKADTAAKADNGTFIAVHSKSGTVHTLTADENAVFLVFQATAGYTAGDTVKIGSATLSAVDVRNVPLADKAFYSGDTVRLWVVGDKAVFDCAGKQLFSSEPSAPREGDVWVL